MRRELLRVRLQSPVITRDWPRWDDLEQKRVVVQPDVINAITRKLTTFRHCILVGPEGRGKTSLARYMGYHQAVAGRTVFYLDLGEPGGDTLDQLGVAIGNLDHAHPFYIVENLHELDDRDEMLQLLGATLATRDSTFLYTERSASNTSVLDAAELSLGGKTISRKDLGILVVPSADFIGSIIQNHVSAHSSLPLVAPEPAEFAALAQQCGQNLRILSAYLDAWDAGRFGNISEQAMLEIIYTRRLAPLAQNLREALIRVSAIAQFGVAVRADVFGVAAVQDLAGLGLLASFHNGIEECFFLPHTTDGMVNIAAWCAAVNAKKSQIVTAAAQCYILADPQPANTSQLLLHLEPDVLRSLTSQPAVALRMKSAFAAGLEAGSLSLSPRGMERLAVDHPVVRLFCTVVKERGPEFLSSKLRQCDEDKVSSTLHRLDSFDHDFTQSVRASLSADDWRGIWGRTRLPRLVRFLYRYATAPEVHYHTKLAGTVLKDVCQLPSFASRLRTVSYELVGKLLLVARRVESSALHDIGNRVSAGLSLEECREPEKLTLILKELALSGNLEAHQKLVNRVLNEVPPRLFYAEQSGRGLAHLLLNVSQVPHGNISQSRKMQIALEWLSPATAEMVTRWDTVALRVALWAGLMLGRDEVKRWVSLVPDTALLYHLQRAEYVERFLLGWNLYQVDRSVFEHVVGKNLQVLHTTLGTSDKISAQEVPFLGLISAVTDVPIDVMAVPSAREVASALQDRLHASRLVFALRFFERHDSDRAVELAATVAKQLKERGVDDVRHVLMDNPLADSAELLARTMDKYFVLGENDSGRKTRLS
jgi:hypothetical protein